MASRRSCFLASYQLRPVCGHCVSKRKKARRAQPIWLRWALAARTYAFSTPQHCFKPRWYCLIPQDKAARRGHGRLPCRSSPTDWLPKTECIPSRLPSANLCLHLLTLTNSYDVTVCAYFFTANYVFLWLQYRGIILFDFSPFFG